ncbi:MAG: EboA domain-containing protein [Chitinophagaceae bacterium]|nr:EboA domain-containing protein [Chitinophagaceae bacterium]
MIPAFERLLTTIIEKNITAETMQWLNQQATLIQQEETAAKLNLAFVFIPRKTGHSPVKISEGEAAEISKLVHGFSINGWTIDRLCRVWLLQQISSTSKAAYCQKIEGLFKTADMNEQTALYSSLSFFDYPEEWQKRCSEGIRSNIGNVLEAIMYNNPYAAKYLNDKAWNQLVLKAFFTEKNINRIVGLDERSNKELAVTLLDYANERWAAHRQVNPQLWRLIANFIDDTSLPHFKKLLESEDEKENLAAALTLYPSQYPTAKELLDQYPELVKQLQQQKLSWNTI